MMRYIILSLNFLFLTKKKATFAVIINQLHLYETK